MSENDYVRAMLRDSARDFAAQSLPRSRLRSLRESPSGAMEMWPRLAELGWTGLLIPAAQGGSGLGVQEMAVVLEELGRVAAPEPLSPAVVLAGTALASCEAGELRNGLLAGLAGGRLVPALAWQESQRLEQGAPATRATRTPAGWLLQGRKRFVRPGAHWHGALIAAETDEGCTLLWVSQGTPGLDVRGLTLADGSLAADLTLSGVQVPEDRMLASPAAGVAVLARALAFARLGAAAELLGIVRSALQLSLEHLRTRVQFGVPIGSFQALRHRTVDLFLQQELVSASLEEACRLADAGLELDALAAAAARVKARASAAGVQAAKDTIQFHGAMGYTDECDAGLLLKRALVLSGWLGNGSELLAQASRQPFAGAMEEGVTA